LRKINSSPTVIKDSDFERELKNVQDRVKALLTIAKQGSGSKYYYHLNIDAKTIWKKYYKNLDFVLINIVKKKINIFITGENKTLVEQLDELREQLNTIDKVYQTVDVTANDARDITEEGLTNIDEAEKVLDKIYEQLTVNIILLLYILFAAIWKIS